MTCDKQYIHRTIVNALSNEGNNSMAWLMSHPKTQDRITAIKKLKDEWE